MIISLYGCNALVSAVVFTRIRFCLPFDYLLIAFVAIFLERFFLRKSRDHQIAFSSNENETL